MGITLATLSKLAYEPEAADSLIKLDKTGALQRLTTY